MPKLSIIVPVYNAENTLTRCIDSILKQTFTDFELILVDDGSPDKCPEMCDSYALKDKRIRVIHQKNSGISAARNAGLVEARGIEIIFIDSDDFVDKNYLKELDLHICDQVSMAICGTNHVIIDNEKNIHLDSTNCPSSQQINKKEYYKLSDLRVLGPVWGKIFLNQIIKSSNLKFDEKMKVGEDKLFVLKYIQNIPEKSKIEIIGKPLYYYRLNNTNKITKHYTDNFVQIGIRINKEFEIMAKTLGANDTKAFVQVKKDKAVFIDFAFDNIMKIGGPKGRLCIKEIKQIINIPGFKATILDNTLFSTSNSFRHVLATQNAVLIYYYLKFAKLKKSLKNKTSQ